MNPVHSRISAVFARLNFAQMSAPQWGAVVFALLLLLSVGTYAYNIFTHPGEAQAAYTVANSARFISGNIG